MIGAATPMRPVDCEAGEAPAESAGREPAGGFLGGAQHAPQAPEEEQQAHAPDEFGAAAERIAHGHAIRDTALATLEPLLPHRLAWWKDFGA
jgi:hypothetical protein